MSEQSPDKTEQKPKGTGKRLFQKGQPSANPNGRPKGSKNKLAEDFLRALSEDFEAHGIEAIRKAREERPAQYVQIVASLMPKDVQVVTKTHEEWLAEIANDG
jgi:hypothetical protein